ncbi:prolipoprotein diacylglyceryl transferase [Tianweitania populi]|uniref:Phosphatidylglycerol--prolipoprotein diacylglyceryl transferase n=1 Tax=Tianweitania populi TaxID=1607949 RepID=A0A8J3DPG7_9HYPH|nr:prolipoprotein diacylglyceryl transferase [Tianweitania populi]GHD11708.1 prolipoprotein diacylglyceryl transferase [Tianweitania populi]
MPISLSALAFPNIDPVAINLGPVPIHWYGIGYVVSILLGWWVSKRLVSQPSLWRNDTPPLKGEDLDDFLMWAALGIVLGGRLGYILFYDLPIYLADPSQIVAVWRGGMSFHGGLLGVVLAIIVFTRKRNIPLFGLIDTMAAVAPIGIGIVRIANFINQELWGKPTDVPWAVIFPAAGPEPRHPSQLYEAALEGLVLFLVLWVLIHVFRKLKSPGFIGGAFITGYGISRIIVEFYRVPDAQLGYQVGTDWITRGMILSLPMVLIGVIAMIWASRVSRRA